MVLFLQKHKITYLLLFYELLNLVIGEFIIVLGINNITIYKNISNLF